MPRGKLFCCVGLPRSGKSTYCDNWVRFNDTIGQALVNNSLLNGENFLYYQRPRVIVAGDDFRTALHGKEYLLEAEAAVFSMMDVAVRALLARGFDVIIDETCTTEDTLSRYLRLDLNFEPVFIDTPASVCIERAIATGKDYLVLPIENMDRQLRDLRPRWDEARARLTDRLRQRYPYAFPSANAQPAA